MATLVMSSASSLSPHMLDPSPDRISALPVEVKDDIIDRLPARDRVHLRLLSREFAVLCAEKLFQDGVFSVRPYRNDMTRLESVSLHPKISKGITHLKIVVGDMSPANFTSAIAMEEELSAEVVDALYKMIDQMNSDMATRLFDTGLLETIFPRLPNLTAITAISDTPWASYGLELDQFCTLLGPDFDPEDYHGIEADGFQDTRLSAKRYLDILLAVKTTQKPLERLALEPIPIDCWALRNLEGLRTVEIGEPKDEEGQENDEDNVDDEDSEDGEDNEDDEKPEDSEENQDDENSEEETEDESEEEWDMILDPSKQELMQTIVKDVWDLRIAMTDLAWRRYDNLNLPHALGQFFGCMRHLRSLDLKWLMYQHQDVQFRDKWMESFYANTWPHLETLKLRRMNTSQSRLLPFLSHVSTLRRLHLSYTWIIAESSLLPILKNDFKLDKFEFLNSTRCEPIYDADWNTIPATSTRGKDVWRIAKLQELYVLGKFEWPLTGYGMAGWSVEELKAGFRNVSERVMTEILDDDDESRPSPVSGFGVITNSE